MKPVSLFFHTSLWTFLDLTVHNVKFLKNSYHFELTDHYFFSHNFWTNKKHGKWASNINRSTVVFNFDVCRLP